MERRLEGKTAVLTGLSGWAGSDIALALAEEGARIVIVADNTDTGEKIACTIENRGGEATRVRCDITDREQIGAMIGMTVERFGSLDIAVHGAGLIPADIHMKSTSLCMQYELDQMNKQGSGIIINTIFDVGYSQVSADVDALTKQAAWINGENGIETYMLHWEDYPFDWEVKQKRRNEKIVRTVLRLCSSSHTYSNGDRINVNSDSVSLQTVWL